MSVVRIPKEPMVCRNFIAGHWTPATSAQKLTVQSPYSNQKIGEVGISTQKDIDQAVQAAHQAFLSWRKVPIKERTQVMYRFRQLVLDRIDEISHVAASECGKTFEEAKAGIQKGLEVTEFAISLQNMDAGSALEVSRGVMCQAKREPLGVVLGIVPFNFPAMVPMWMYPIAITLGNSFVIKPSEKVPLTTQMMADCLQKTGLPDGVFTVVNGDRSTVEGLIDHPLIQAVAFVGSTPVAKAVYQRATHHGKRALCLGGAKNHILLAPDADVEVAVPGIVSSFTGCAGQRCMAGSVLIAVGECDELISAITNTAAKIRMGLDMGAIIDKTSLQRIRDEIGKAEQQGARIILDGRSAKAPAGFDQGNWIGPTIIDQATPQMDCVKHEIFGPVLTILRADSLHNAMELEASCPFGNATSVFTTSGAVAKYVADHASTGMIGVNIGVPVPREPFSFGGTKESKFGQGDITGMSSLDFWTNLKKVTTKWSMQKDHNWMS